MALNRYKLRHKARSGHRGARFAEQLLQRPDRLITLILFGNNLVNFSAATLASYLALRLFGSSAWVTAAGTFVFTLAVLIFAEVTPKTLAATDWMAMKRVAWHRSGMPCKVLKPDHELLKGVFDKKPNPTWLKGSTLAFLGADDFENIIGTDKGDCLLGMRKVGEGWIAYLGHEYFRMTSAKSPDHADAPAYLALVRNIILTADPALAQ